LSQGRTDVYKVDPRQLYVKSNWNGRNFQDPDNLEHIETLSLSIAEIGVKEPITVSWENGKAWLVDGECRLRATLLAIERGADIKTVPVKTEDKHANDADRLFSQIIRNSGKPFTQVEQASVYKRLLDFGWSQVDIARKAGISASRVSQVLSFLMMPEGVKHLVATGQVPIAVARQTIRTDGAEAIHVLNDALATAKAEGKTKVTARFLNGGRDEIEILDDEDIPFLEEPPRKTRGPTLEKLMFDAFDSSIIDQDMVNEGGKPVVVITMPLDQFERIRTTLKL
jgi:ParB/RepB/Spo0J family partition protein